jgi:hypothetical protein
MKMMRRFVMKSITSLAGSMGARQLPATWRMHEWSVTGEEFKQYLLTIVIYLVTGGHHSCHEIFSVANLLTGPDGPRTPGSSYTVSEPTRGASGI